MSDLWASEMREADSFNIPSANNFCLNLFVPGTASFLFPLKDRVLWSDLARGLVCGKSNGFRIDGPINRGH